MTGDWSVPAWAVLVTVVVVLLLMVVGAVAALIASRSRSRTVAALAQARTDAEALRAQVERIERRLERPQHGPQHQPSHRPVVDDTEYVITRLGDEPAPPARADVEPVPVVAGSLFADLVLREGVVQAGSLAAGLRRALAPQTRHRIGFEMRREVKRARKQRRLEVRQARRELQDRQRSAA